MIMVFGSNQAGRHGKGAALYAREHHGAVYGQGQGHFGNSYAIPTKDALIRTLPLEVIKRHVDTFIGYAIAHPELKFQLTPTCPTLGIPHHMLYIKLCMNEIYIE